MRKTISFNFILWDTVLPGETLCEFSFIWKERYKLNDWRNFNYYLCIILYNGNFIWFVSFMYVLYNIYTVSTPPIRYVVILLEWVNFRWNLSVSYIKWRYLMFHRWLMILLTTYIEMWATFLFKKVILVYFSVNLLFLRKFIGPNGPYISKSQTKIRNICLSGI